ncbi:hypothetical protein ACHAWF_018336, partial [Thalassiosira exigua]
ADTLTHSGINCTQELILYQRAVVWGRRRRAFFCTTARNKTSTRWRLLVCASSIYLSLLRKKRIRTMSTATQRKAWNEAMRSAGAVLPASAAASGAAASSRRGGVASRAADRRRKRRDRARKSSVYGDGGGGGGASSLEEKEYRVAIHMDVLEGVADGGALEGDEDDEYDEFAELEEDDDDEGGKAKKKRKRKGAGGGTGKKSPSVPKYLKPRSLASILIEEAGREDSVARQYADAAVRRLGSGLASARSVDSQDGTVTTKATHPHPARKFCPVTGLFGKYTEPKSGIPYASLSALEQIRERPPPWMSLGSSGSASYWEAIKSIQSNP